MNTICKNILDKIKICYFSFLSIFIILSELRYKNFIMDECNSPTDIVQHACRVNFMWTEKYRIHLVCMRYF